MNTATSSFRSVFRALLTSAVVLASASAWAASPTPSTPWLQSLVEKARVLASERVKPGTEDETKWKGRIKSVVDDILDWEELTRQSLGSEWSKLSDAEKKEFSSLLREMVEASYLSKLQAREKGEDPKVEVKWISEDTKDERSKAIAEVKSGKTKTNLEFQMRWLGSQWRVYDVSIDEVGTIRTYRSQFRKLITDKGFAGLIARMKQKTEEIRKGLGDLRDGVSEDAKKKAGN